MLGMKTFAPLVLFTVASTASAPAKGPNGAKPANAGERGLTIEDMLAMQRVSDPQVSPDGKWVAFSVRDTDYDANKGRFDVYLAPVDGGAVTQLTTSDANDTD